MRSETVVRWLLMAATAGVSLVAGRAEETGAAKVIALVGQVSVLRDNSPWALSVGDSIQPRQIIISGADGFAVLELSDGSKFEVFANSKVIFRDNPGNWKDLLDVLMGRVKVYIQKLGGQPNINRVRTPTAVISVRGTVFNVDVEDEDATTLVMVEEGQVWVQHAMLPRGSPKVLNPGEWVRVFKNQPLAAKSLDRGAVLHTTFRAAAEALYGIIYRSSRGPSGPAGPGSPAGGGTPLPGDKGGDKNPPPPPPPPPPAGH